MCSDAPQLGCLSSSLRSLSSLYSLPNAKVQQTLKQLTTEAPCHKRVNALLECLCTPYNASGISVCTKKANECSLSYDLLKSLCYVIDRTVVPRRHIRHECGLRRGYESGVTLIISLFVDEARADTNQRPEADPGVS